MPKPATLADLVAAQQQHNTPAPPVVPAFIDPDAPELCRHCGGATERCRSKWTADGGTVRDPNGYSSDLFHVGGGVRCPEGTPGLVPLAERIPRCPKCRSTDWRYEPDAWADNYQCGNDQCGHRERYSLGD